MAQVILVVQDEEDGSVQVRLFSEPNAAKIERENFTMAQHLGATALNAISQEMATNPPIVKAGKPKLKLIIVGQDEMPH